MHIKNQPRAHIQFETKNGELIITPLANVTFRRFSDHRATVQTRFYAYLEQIGESLEITDKEFHEIMAAMGMKPV
jgi:hypothetical protein